MMRKYTILFFLLLLLNTKYIAQINLITQQAQNVATPEVASLMKFSYFSSMSFIGKTDLSVPIYNIKFGELQIPISLSYNTKGNRVSDIATSVGLGWSLISGGNLSVKINDMNDFQETYSYYTTATFEPELSLAWSRQSKGYLTREEPLLDGSNTYQLCLKNIFQASDDIFQDSAPDFYYINAPGFNDKFYLTQNKLIEYDDIPQYTAHFFNSTNAKLKNTVSLIPKILCASVESTDFGNMGSASVYYQVDKFEIVGENGYIYTFNDFEYARLSEFPKNIVSHDSYQVNNWYLTKIKDPYSGREINFEYESYTNNYEHPALTTLGDINFGNYPMAYNYELGRMNSNLIYPYVYNKVTTYQLYPKRIKKITTDQEVVDFQYSFNRVDYPGSGLTNIQVKNKKGNIIKQTDFNYDYFDSLNCTSGDYECKRLKLNSITDSNIGTYRFYYDSNSFPPRNSSKVDFLGYYNNNDSNIIFSKNDFHESQYGYYPGTKVYFYPDLTKDQLFPFQLINKQAFAITNGVDRSPKSISKLGLLQKIIYPTGGFLEINYENDDFMYEGEKYILGSTRVSKMKLYNSENVISKEIDYKYVNENNESSGQINFLKTPSNSAHTEISSGIGFSTDAIVGYSRILEKVEGKGYIERKYSNFNDYPDKFMTSDYNFSDQKTKNFLKFLKFPSSYVQSFDERRGRILAENYYKEGVVSPLKKISYLYDYRVKDSLKVQKIFSSYFSDQGMDNWENDYTATNYLLHYFNNLKNVKKEEFFSGISLKEENMFNYDDARLIYKKMIIGSDTSEEYYRNAIDKSIQKLIDANILDKHVEVEKNKNGKTLIKQEVKYDNTTSILPSSEVLYDLNNNQQTEIIYDKYDSKSNLLQFTDKTGLPRTIIYGYNQTQPIAKIEGATYAQIMQAFSLSTTDASSYLGLDIVKKSDLDVDDASEQILLTTLDSFRNNTAFKDFQITTYTYNPLIGVTSITPPSGIREIYKYDTANRLQSVVDVNGNILKEYNYNYSKTKYHSSELSKAFTKNDCNLGYKSYSQYTYNVPSSKYTSFISQADADQKALNDLNSNGQALANSTGKCEKIFCNLIPTSSLSYVNVYYSAFEYESATTIKAYLYVNFPNAYNIDWKNNMFPLGTICKDVSPSDFKYITPPGTSWFVQISPDGSVYLKWNGTGNPTLNSNSVSFNFSYIK